MCKSSTDIFSFFLPFSILFGTTNCFLIDNTASGTWLISFDFHEELRIEIWNGIGTTLPLHFNPSFHKNHCYLCVFSGLAIVSNHLSHCFTAFSLLVSLCFCLYQYAIKPDGCVITRVCLENKDQDGKTAKEDVPALSAPATVGGDQHLAAVVQVRAVHVQLQLLSLRLPQHREEVLLLFGGSCSNQCDFDFRINAVKRYNSPAPGC